MSPDYPALLDRVVRVPGVHGALVVGEGDGLVIAEVVMEGTRAAAVAALACSLAGRLRRAGEAAGRGAPRFLHLTAAGGSVLVARAPGAGVLVVAIARPGVNVGLARLELLQAAERVG